MNMNFTHVDRVAYNMPARNVSIGLFVQCNTNYLASIPLVNVMFKDVLCVVKAETVPVFQERIYYSAINQT